MVVRCRPMSRKETEDNRQKVVEMDKHRGCVRDRCLWRPCVHASPRVLVVWQVILHNAGGSGEPPKTFTFDQVYDDTSQQEVTHTHTRPQPPQPPQPPRLRLRLRLSVRARSWARLVARAAATVGLGLG